MLDTRGTTVQPSPHLRGCGVFSAALGADSALERAASSGCRNYSAAASAAGLAASAALNSFTRRATVSESCAPLALPESEAFGVDRKADGLAGSHRVIVADAFDEAAVTTAARVANVDGVEGTLLRAAAGETNDDHEFTSLTLVL